jgi:putative spermidine/putrescine transport system ATP-binding protein
MSTRIAVFNDGVVQQLSSPDELYERPVNSFVAQFIGENNRLRGRVLDVGTDKIADVQLDSGEMVKALAINAGKNSPTLLSVRPERVEINPSAKSADTILNGKIRELIYLGDHVRVRLNVAGHDDFIVKVPNKAGGAGIEHGSSVKVGWNAADCRALDDAAIAAH